MSSFCDYILAHPYWSLKYAVKLRYNPDWLRNFYGSVPEATILSLISKSAKAQRLRVFLIAVIEQMDGSDITDQVFNKLVNYVDPETRETLVVSLCHKKLTEWQLISLCDIGTQFECFFELAHLYYKDNHYSVVDLQHVAERIKRSKFDYMYLDLLRELTYDYSACEEPKRNWILSELV